MLLRSTVGPGHWGSHVPWPRHGVHRVLQNDALKSQSSVPVNATLCGDGVMADVTREVGMRRGGS